MSAVGGEIRVVLTLDDKDFSVKTIKAGNTISELKRTLDTTGESVKHIEKRMTSFGSRMRDLTLTLSIARFAFRDFQDMILAFPSAILKTTGEFQRMTTLLEGMSKETDVTKRKLEALAGKKYIIQLAMNSPFKIEAIQDAFVKFKSVGLDPANGGLKALVDGVAKFGGSSDLLHRSSIAIQQMIGKGVVSMEELRQQLGEAIPDAMQIMATGAGVTVGELVAQVSKGTVEASTAVGNMLAIMAVENQGAAEAMSKTWPGTMDRISTSFSLFLNTIGENKFAENMQKQAEKLLAAMNSMNTANFARDIGDSLNSITDGLVAVIRFFREWGTEVKAVASVLATLYVASKLGKMVGEYKKAIFDKIAAIKMEVQAVEAAEINKARDVAAGLRNKRALERVAYTEKGKELVAETARQSDHNKHILHLENQKQLMIREMGQKNAMAHFNMIHAAEMNAYRQKSMQSARRVAELAAEKAAYHANFADLSRQITAQTTLATSLGQTTRAMGLMKGVMTSMGSVFAAMGGWVTVITASLIYAATKLVEWLNRAKTAKKELENEQAGRTGEDEFQEFNTSGKLGKQRGKVAEAGAKLTDARERKKRGEAGYDADYITALEASMDRQTAKLKELEDKHARLRINNTKAVAAKEVEALRHTTETQLDGIHAIAMQKVAKLRKEQQDNPKINNSQKIIDLDTAYATDALKALRVHQAKIGTELAAATGEQRTIFAAEAKFIDEQIKHYETTQANLLNAGKIVTISGADKKGKSKGEKEADRYADLIVSLKDYIALQESANLTGERASQAMRKIQDIKADLVKHSGDYSAAQKAELEYLAKRIETEGILSISLKSKEADREFEIKNLRDQTNHEIALLNARAHLGQITEEVAAVMGLLADARNRDLAISKEEAKLKEDRDKLGKAGITALETAELKAQITERERAIAAMKREGAQLEELNLIKAAGEVDNFIEKTNNDAAKAELDIQKQIRNEIQSRLPLNELEADMLRARNGVEDKYADLIQRNELYLKNTLEAGIAQLEIQRAAQQALGPAGADNVARIDAALAIMRNGVIKVKNSINELNAASGKMSDEAAQAAFSWTKALAPLGKSFENVFGKAGKTISSLVGSFAKLKDAQVAYGKELANIAELEKTKPEAAAEAHQKLNHQMIENSLETYGEMAGAAKGFFDEQSTAYKVLGGIEQAMYMMKFAMQLKAIAMDLLYTKSSVANSGTRATADGIAGFAKTIASLPFPWNIAAGAAVLASLVAIGVKMSGGGAASTVSVSEQRQKTQGTGTVLGSPEEQSNSLANSLELLAELNTENLRYSARMTASLENIEYAMTGVSSMIFRTPGLTSGNLSGTPEMSKTGTLGFSSKSVAVTDSGLTYEGLIGGIFDGLKAYTDVTTNKSSWWGLSKSTKTSTVTTDANDDIANQFQMIFTEIGSSLLTAGRVFGESVDILETKLNALTIDFDVSLKGLTGEDLTAAINATISASADQVALTLFPWIKEYQAVGEGAYQTAMRVAVSTEFATNALGLFGLSLGETSQEMIAGSMSLVDMAGGLEALQSKLDFFFENFYSEFEQFVVGGRDLAMGFANLNLAVPKTAAEFRNLVNSQDTLTVAGRQTWNSLMDLAPAFYKIIKVFEDVRASIAATTASTLEDMRMSTMTQEQQYNFLREKSIGLEAQLAASVDPEEIASLTAEINSTSMAAWQLLGESEKAIKLAEYEEYLTEIEALANTRLGMAQDAIVAVDETDLSSTIQSSIDVAMTRVAERMEAAALRMEEAAGTPITGSATVYIENGNSSTSAEVGLTGG